MTDCPDCEGVGLDGFDGCRCSRCHGSGRVLSNAGYPSGRGCTCADPVCLPDPGCPECARVAVRAREEIGYGP